MNGCSCNDIYANGRRTNVACIKELVCYINKMLACSTLDAEGVLLVLASLTTYFTFEEIYQTFPVYNNSIANAVGRLVKRGYLKGNSFPRFDGMSKKYFSITAAGHDVANSFFLGTVPIRYKYGRKENSISHIYSMGINLFAFLSFGIPVVWKREVVYGQTGIIRADALQTDAYICVYERTENRRQFFIEQDMGFERDAVLYGKMERYAQKGIMRNPQDAIIFSFRYKNISVTKPSRAGTIYSRTGVENILSRLKEHEIKDARELLEIYPDDLFLQEFLILCDAARLKKGRIEPIFGSAIDEDFLREFLFSLKFHVNKYVLKDLNKKQAVLAKNRLAQFVGLFFDWMNKGQISGIMLQMNRGFPVYFIPTSLMRSYGDIFFLEELGLKKRIENTLKNYYGPLEKYQILTPELRLKNGYSLRLRNAFSYTINGEKEGYVCVEFLNADLAAWIRLRLFQGYYEGDKPVHFVAVFDDQKQVGDMYNYFGCYYPQIAIVLDRKAVLSCMYYDLGREGKIFSITDPFGTERIYHNDSCTYDELLRPGPLF